jgi:hypothetical protein
MSALVMVLVLAATDAGRPVERPLYYGEQKIGAAELEGRTLRELTLMRNWIYARAGNGFRRHWLDAFFKKQDWYSPMPVMDEGALTDMDRENADAIASHEAKLTVAQLTKLRDEARARHDDLELRLLSVRLGGWAGEGEAPKDLSPLEDPTKLDALLKLKALDDFSPRDLKLLRNTVFARRGRPFTTDDMKGHLATVAWYQADPKYTDARLTAVDKKNVQLIKSLETSLKVKERANWYGAA